MSQTIPAYKMHNGQVIAPVAKAKTVEQQRADRVKYNRKRGLRVTRQVRQNFETRNQLNDWWQADEVNLTDNEMYYFAKFRKSIASCGHNSLYRVHSDSAMDYIGSHTCDHKYCAVCNAERSKKTRRAYRNFFESYPDLIKNYDFMHLTLTVPHTEKSGWRGKKFYASELMKEFNYMRKKAWWKKAVYAGEFGIELTKNESGMHIHIHSMLLVHRTTKSRNNLHKKILLAWNKQTADKEKDFEPLEAERIEAILKSNDLLNKSDCFSLNATGATIIGLESLYIKSGTKKPSFIYCERSGFYKRYINPSDNFEAFMGGVMECIKYHFEPMAMKEDGKVDFELMREILPMIDGKPLYRKFGAFHAGTKNAHEGAKTLNFNHKYTPEEKADEILQEVAHEEVIHPETLQTVEPQDYTYCIIPAYRIYYDKDKNLRPGIFKNALKDVKYTNTNNLNQALFMMLEKGISDKIKQNEQKLIRV